MSRKLEANTGVNVPEANGLNICLRPIVHHVDRIVAKEGLIKTVNDLFDSKSPLRHGVEMIQRYSFRNKRTGKEIPNGKGLHNEMVKSSVVPIVIYSSMHKQLQEVGISIPSTLYATAKVAFFAGLIFGVESSTFKKNDPTDIPYNINKDGNNAHLDVEDGHRSGSNQWVGYMSPFDPNGENKPGE